jgi:hypothetical protein
LLRDRKAATSGHLDAMGGREKERDAEFDSWPPSKARSSQNVVSQNSIVYHSLSLIFQIELAILCNFKVYSISRQPMSSSGSQRWTMLGCLEI